MLWLILASFLLALVFLMAAILESLGRWISERFGEGRTTPVAFEAEETFRIAGDPRQSPAR